MAKSTTFGLFLGDLSLFCNEEDLRQAFEPFGTLVEVRIKRSKENKKNLSYGFVEYSSPVDAIKAMQVMDGQILCGRALKVRWASKKQGAAGKMMVDPAEKVPKDTPGTASIYVSFTCFNVMGDVTEEILRAVFEKYGEVVDVTIKYSTYDEKANMQKGYGFVSYKEDYEGYASVLAALGELANATIGNVSYKCELSRASKMLLEHHEQSTVPPPGSTHGGYQDSLSLGTHPANVSSMSMDRSSDMFGSAGASALYSNNGVGFGALNVNGRHHGFQQQQQQSQHRIPPLKSFSSSPRGEFFGAGGERGFFEHDAFLVQKSASRDNVYASRDSAASYGMSNMRKNYPLPPRPPLSAHPGNGWNALQQQQPSQPMSLNGYDQQQRYSNAGGFFERERERDFGSNGNGYHHHGGNNSHAAGIPSQKNFGNPFASSASTASTINNFTSTNSSLLSERDSFNHKFGGNGNVAALERVSSHSGYTSPGMYSPGSLLSMSSDNNNAPSHASNGNSGHSHRDLGISLTGGGAFFGGDLDHYAFEDFR